MNGTSVLIRQEIRVGFHQATGTHKNPACPDFFIWVGKTYMITQLEGEWKDFDRKGDASRNMRRTHAERAQARGSWGVGRFYFRVLTACGRKFELYYDRVPHGQNKRQGTWNLLAEQT